MDVCRDVFRVVLELSDGKGASTVCFLLVMSCVTAKNHYIRLISRGGDNNLISNNNTTHQSKIEDAEAPADTETISVLKVYYLDGYPVALDVNENFTMKDICAELFHDFKVGLYEVEREIGPMQEHKLLPAEMTVGDLIKRWKSKNWPDAKLVVPIYLKDWSLKVNHKSVRHVRFENSYLTASPSTGRRSFTAIRNDALNSPTREREHRDNSSTSPASSEGSVSPNMGSAARARTHAFFSTLFVTRDDIDPRENSTSVTEMSWENSLRRNVPNRRHNNPNRTPTHSPNASSANVLAHVAPTASAVATTSIAAQPPVPAVVSPVAQQAPPTPPAAAPAPAPVQPTLRESNSTHGHSNSIINAPTISQESTNAPAAETPASPAPAQRPIATLVLPQIVSTPTVLDYNSYTSPVSDRRRTRTPPSSAASATSAVGSSGEKVRPRTTYVHLAAEPHSSRTSSPAHTLIATTAASPTIGSVAEALSTERSPQTESPATTDSSASTHIVAATVTTPSPLRSRPASNIDVHVLHTRTNAILSRLFKMVEEEHRTENSSTPGDVNAAAPASGEKAGPEDEQAVASREAGQLQGELSPLSMGTVSRSTSPATSVNTLNSGVESVSPGGSRRKRRLARSPAIPIVRPPFDTSTSTPTLSLLLSLPVGVKSPAPANMDADNEGTERDGEIRTEDTTIETGRTPNNGTKRAYLTPASYHTPTRAKRTGDETGESVSSSVRSRRASASVLSNNEASMLSNNNISFSSALRAAGRIRKGGATPTGTPSTANAKDKERAKEHLNATPTLKSARSKASVNVSSSPFVTTVRSASANEPIGSIGVNNNAVAKRFRSPGNGSVSGNSRTASPHSTTSNVSRDVHYAHSYAQHHPAEDRERAGYSSGDNGSVSHPLDTQRRLFEEQKRQNRARSTSPHSAVTVNSGASGHSRQAGNRRGSVQPGRWVP